MCKKDQTFVRQLSKNPQTKICNKTCANWSHNLTVICWTIIAFSEELSERLFCHFIVQIIIVYCWNRNTFLPAATLKMAKTKTENVKQLIFKQRSQPTETASYFINHSLLELTFTCLLLALSQHDAQTRIYLWSGLLSRSSRWAGLTNWDD